MAPNGLIKWGIVGAGRISNDFCAALTSLSPDDHQIVAVAARSEESAKKFADTFKIARFYEGYEKLAADKEIGKNRGNANESLREEFIILQM